MDTQGMARRRKRRVRRRYRKRFFLLLLVLGAVIGGIVWNIDHGITKERQQVDEIGSIPVITDFIPKETSARPGTQRKVKYIVIHETGNTGKNADGASHNNYLHNNADKQTTSWHYTVDDSEIYHHIPDNEIAFHAGDQLKKNGGNLNGIGIEMCVNPENDYEKTLKNAAALTAFLMKSYGLDLNDVRKHQDFSGKNCPERLIEAGRWNEFLEMVKAAQ